ncbi:MAG: TonB-dependent receptor [Proteobacteria bacterium]|nr:TonB-dependent receptor [Pseudomonadota bacterium]
MSDVRFAVAIPRLCLVLLCLLFAQSAFGQTTGSLRVHVTDGFDDPVPRASVTLSAESMMGGDQTRVARDDGSALFVELLPGTYDITVEHDAFRTAVVSGLTVTVRQRTEHTLVLRGGDEPREVILVEPPPKPIDPTDVTRGERFGPEMLDQLPTGQSISTAIGMASGVVGEGRFNPQMGGSGANENTVLLDGAEITDPVTGTFSSNFSYSALEQVEVLLGGYEPEYGVSLGGIVNLVTRSGSNNVEFDTSVFYSNGDLRGRLDERWGADGRQLAPSGFDSTYQDLNVGARVSGPLIKDRLWFIISTQHARSRIAVNGTPQARDYDAHYVLGKITAQPTSEHRLTAFLQLDPTSIDNQSQGSAFIKAEAQRRQAQGGFVTQGRWQWLPSHAAALDTRIVVQKQYLETSAVPCTHNAEREDHPCKPTEAEGDVDWETPGRVGLNGAMDSVNWGTYAFDDRWRYQASSKLSLFELPGGHDVKIGVEMTHTVWDQLQGISGNSLYTDTQTVSYDPASLANYYWIETTGPISFRTTGSEASAFVQDAWAIRPNLTVKYGVRFDRAVMRNDVGDPVIQGNLWGPRLYAAWDPTADGKTKIAGGFGRFNDTGRLGTAAFTAQSAYGSKLFLGEAFADGALGVLAGQGQSYSVTPPESRREAHDQLSMPRADEVMLIVERQLWNEVAVGGSISGKFTRTLYEFDDTNRIYDEDGSQVIGSRSGDGDISAYRLRTPKLAVRDYLQADLFVQKVLARRWFGKVTWSTQRSRGTSPAALSGAFANDPQTQFAYGNLLGTDLRHAVKAYGSWKLPTDPFTQTLGFTFRYESGRPLERRYAGDDFGSIRIRPRDAYTRTPGWLSMSAKLTQDIPVARGALQLDLEALNLFNNRSPTAVSASTLQDQNRLVTLGRQSPFRLQMGARYRF